MDRLLTIEDLAGRYPVPEATWRYWRYKGTGPRSTRIGRRVVYREADVEAWISEQFERADKEPA